jgi:hypothetical protein
MALCGSSSCGCAFASASLNISGSGTAGDPVRLETYDAIATDAPDTRPGPGDRFPGMRVWTTDTRRLYVWETGPGYTIVAEPPQPWTITAIIQGFTTVPVSTIRAHYQRSIEGFRAVAAILVTGPGSVGGALDLPLPFTIPNLNDVFGDYNLYNQSGSNAHAGTIVPWSVTRFRLQADNVPSSGHLGSNSFTEALAAGDEIRFSLMGRLA